MADLLAALDAAQGEAVAWALTMPDGIRMLHMTEKASRRAEAAWQEAYAGCQHLPLCFAPQAPPAAVADWLPQPGEVEYVGDAGPVTNADFVDTPAAVAASLANALARMDECRAGCDAGDPFYADPTAWDIVRAHLAQQPAAAVPAANVTPMRQPRADLARLVESINVAVYANGYGLSVTEAIGALELAKLELLKEQEQ